MTDKHIEIIEPEKFTDPRGCLTFFPSWDLSKIKRTYIIEHPNTEIIRAWQGHKTENKWFFPIQGEFEILLIQPDNWADPSPDLTPTIFTISGNEFKILHVPGGYASGIRAIEPNSKLLVFSNFTTQESKEDDFRFDKHLWHKW